MVERGLYVGDFRIDVDGICGELEDVFVEIGDDVFFHLKTKYNLNKLTIFQEKCEEAIVTVCL